MFVLLDVSVEIDEADLCSFVQASVVSDTLLSFFGSVLLGNLQILVAFGDEG